MISSEEARWIVAGLDAGDLARRVWRASQDEDGEARNAEAELLLRTGDVLVHPWGRNSTLVARPATTIVLATTTATRREDVEAEARRGTKVPPSNEVIEEGVVREARREGLDHEAIERQLRRAYEVMGEGAA